MKQANSTEIDRLLQRHARRADAARVDGSDRAGVGASQAGAPAGAHLDADEMCAYAEGALPDAARVVAVAHLADCDSCRKIVTDLVLAAEVAGRESGRIAAQGVAPSKPWWSAIAALFAPPVLRYAVPALLLLGIIVVAFVATRDRRENQLVALNEQKQAGGTASKEEAHAPSEQTTPGESAGANTTTTTMNTNQASAGTSNASPSEGVLAKNANASQAPPAPITTVTTPAPSGAPDDTKKGGKLDDQLYAKEPKEAPAPQAAEQSTTASKTVAKEKTVEEGEARKPNEAAPTNRTETADLARSKDEVRNNPSVAGGSATGQAASPQAGARTAGRSRRDARSEDAGADDKANLSSSTETRSVSGRRFRRQGNAWVDTAYNSSRSTINVARGSDHYRALVADEPAIQNIADQLGGEVIVVWKGKAYRIY